jgi:HD-GYP domain-containing protein (c-di-GMP phosphodiesterase class II)
MSQIKISVNRLQIGMYVSNLDRPWVETPFLFQGFHVKDPAIIEELAKYCKHVYVDDEQGKAPDEQVTVFATEQAGGVIHVEDEAPKAQQIQTRISQEFKNVVENIRTGGELDVVAISKEVDHMVAGCLRNVDAYLLLTKLKSKDDYTYSHCLSSAIFAVMMGRHMGLNKNELEELAFGHMFFDIGMIKLPTALINKTSAYTEEEKATFRKHVHYSVEILNAMKGGVKPSAIDIAMHHHERFDGSGYPLGLKGNQIPLYARIAGIIDTYDTLTSKRPHAKAISHDEAIRSLYKTIDRDFQKDILETFIQCLGTYPSGSLVELNSGEVGIVLQQNRISRLRPRVMLILNPKKEFNNYFPILNLLTKPTDSHGRTIEISKLLTPGTYDIDPSEFYLQMTGTGSGQQMT